MKFGSIAYGAIAACVLATGCQTAEDVTEEVVTTMESEPVVEAAACPVVESSNWGAFINRMPGPDAEATLNVHGQVTMPTPEFTFEWQEGPMDRSAIPTMRVKLIATAPDGMVMQALTTETVVYKVPALATGYKKIIVSCDDEVLAEITDIEEVS